MEGLDLDNILDEDAMSLFNDDGTQEDTTPEDTPDNTGDNEQKEKRILLRILQKECLENQRA